MQSNKNENKCKDCAGCSEWVCDCSNEREQAIKELREKCMEHQDFHKGDDGVFRAYISIEDLDRVIDEM